jgi:hypothetical protein
VRDYGDKVQIAKQRIGMPQQMKQGQKGESSRTETAF